MFYDLYDKEELKGYIDVYRERMSKGVSVETLYNEIGHEYNTYLGPQKFANERFFKNVQGLAYAYIELGNEGLTGFDYIDHYIKIIKSNTK